MEPKNYIFERISKICLGPREDSAPRTPPVFTPSFQASKPSNRS